MDHIVYSSTGAMEIYSLMECSNCYSSDIELDNLTKDIIKQVRCNNCSVYVSTYGTVENSIIAWNEHHSLSSSIRKKKEQIKMLKKQLKTLEKEKAMVGELTVPRILGVRNSPTEYCKILGSLRAAFTEEEISFHLSNITKWSNTMMKTFGTELLLKAIKTHSKVLYLHCLPSSLLSLRYIQEFGDVISAEEILGLEHSIATSGINSLTYAVEVLKDRFPEGEPSIISHGMAKTSYIKFLRSVNIEMK